MSTSVLVLAAEVRVDGHDAVARVVRRDGGYLVALPDLDGGEHRQPADDYRAAAADAARLLEARAAAAEAVGVARGAWQAELEQPPEAEGA